MLVVSSPEVEGNIDQPFVIRHLSESS